MSEPKGSAVAEMAKTIREVEQVLIRRGLNRPKKTIPKRIKRRLRFRKKHGQIRGLVTQNRVTRLLKILRDQGKVSWFRESQKNDWDDRHGIDQWGELSLRYGSVRFAIDAKSSLLHLKGGSGKYALIFVPVEGAPDQEEAKRLFLEIRKRFGKEGSKTTGNLW